MAEIKYISLVVRDYDEAIAWYTQTLGFELIEDTALSETKRWVLVQPQGGQGMALLLAKAANEDQSQAIGNQTGGRVFLFMHVEDFDSEYVRMRKEGVIFLEEPRDEIYGKVVVFEDLYGNKWDMIQPA